ncbi:MAG TPA: nucleotidyltransferase domain-containing protein [Solirubrobacterales bacterium]
MIVSERDFERIVATILAGEIPEEIYVFGSYGKGVATEGSDVDLLIVAPSPLPRPHRGKRVAAALASFPGRFDVLCFTREELEEETREPGSFMATVMSTARRLYPPPAAE